MEGGLEPVAGVDLGDLGDIGGPAEGSLVGRGAQRYRESFYSVQWSKNDSRSAAVAAPATCTWSSSCVEGWSHDRDPACGYIISPDGTGRERERAREDSLSSQSETVDSPSIEFLATSLHVFAFRKKFFILSSARTSTGSYQSTTPIRSRWQSES